MPSDFIPPPVKIKSLQALVQLKGKEKHRWNVFAYVINKDVIREDGSIDDLRAMVFCLGSFSDQKKAEEHAAKVIEMTGHRGIKVAYYAVPVPISTNPREGEGAIKEVHLDDKGKLIKMEDQRFEEDKKFYEERKKLEREMMEEADAELDSTTVEYFKKQTIIALHNRDKVERLKAELAEAEEAYQRRKKLVQEHYKEYPEHESEWLKTVEKHSKRYGNQQLYHQLSKVYTQHRAELLDLKCDGDVCSI